jgi:hypothetical protein
MKWGILLVMFGLVASQTEALEYDWDWKFLLENDDCAFFYSPGAFTGSIEDVVERREERFLC